MTTNHKTLLGHRASVPEWLAQHLMNQKVLGSNPSNCFFRIQNACTSLQEKSKGKLVSIFPLGFSVVFIYHLKTARSSSMLINANNVFVLLFFFFFFRTFFVYFIQVQDILLSNKRAWSHRWRLYSRTVFIYGSLFQPILERYSKVAEWNVSRYCLLFISRKSHKLNSIQVPS